MEMSPVPEFGTEAKCVVCGQNIIFVGKTGWEHVYPHESHPHIAQPEGRKKTHEENMLEQFQDNDFQP